MPRRKSIEQLYEEHKRLLMAICWGFVKAWGGQFDDYMGEANYKFMLLARSPKWDRTRPLAPLLRKAVTNHLRNMIKARTRCREEAYEVLPDVPTNQTPYSRMALGELGKGLSDEAGYIINLLLEGPVEVLGLLGSEPAGRIRRRIVLYMKEQGYRNHNKTWAAFRELKEAIECL